MPPATPFKSHLNASLPSVRIVAPNGRDRIFLQPPTLTPACLPLSALCLQSCHLPPRAWPTDGTRQRQKNTPPSPSVRTWQTRPNALSLGSAWTAPAYGRTLSSTFLPPSLYEKQSHRITQKAGCGWGIFRVGGETPTPPLPTLSPASPEGPFRCRVEGNSFSLKDSCRLKGEFFWLKVGKPRNEPCRTSCSKGAWRRGMA